MPPLVSVLVPVYNGEAFIETTVREVLNQPLQDIEVIITDNASTDSTPELMEALAASDPRVSAVRNPRNLGPLGNLRRGLELSTGTFVKWQAVDDYLDPRFLGEAVEMLRSHPDASMVVGPMPPVATDRVPLPFDPERGVYVAPHGELVSTVAIPEACEAPSPSDRFRCVVDDVKANVIAEFLYGMFRGSALRSADPFKDLYLGSEKVLIAKVLFGGRALLSESPSSQRVYHPGHFGARNFRDTVQGLDPQFDGRFAFPAARQALGYLGAIASSDLPLSERAKCLTILGSKVANPRTLGRLVRPGPENYFGWGR